MSQSIAAVVVTYNRLEMLKSLIESIRRQTRRPDEIIVVNNSSTDGTGEWLNQQPDLTVLTQGNLGSSGGQYTVIKAAFDRGHDWIWTMDDDVEPVENCLERLMYDENPNIVRAPLRFTSTGKPYFNDAIAYNLTNPFRSFWKGVISEKDLLNEKISANGITFEGPVFHRSVVEKIGLPEKKFFIFGDDTEYFIRASSAGFDIQIIRDARFNRKIDPTPGDRSFNWKYYYIIRNIIAIDVLHGNMPVRLIRPFRYLLKFLLLSRSLSNLKTTLKAFSDGYFYKSGN